MILESFKRFINFLINTRYFIVPEIIDLKKSYYYYDFNKRFKNKLLLIQFASSKYLTILKTLIRVP